MIVARPVVPQGFASPTAEVMEEVLILAANEHQTAASGEIVGKPANAHKTSLDTARRQLDNPIDSE